MHKAIENKGRGTKVVDDIFHSDATPTLIGQNRTYHRSISLNVKQHLNNKRRCMAMLLFEYLTGQKIPIIYTFPNAAYKITTDAHQTFDLFAQLHKPRDKLIAVTKALTTVFDSCSIDNLSTFLLRILQEQSNTMSEFTAYECDFGTIDKNDTYAKLLDKIRGCYDQCPCCLRPCDFDHTTRPGSKPGSEDSKHRCATGHALRAMNGYKFEETKEASLFMCERIPDDQLLIVGSIRKKWSQFKLDHSDWLFESLLNDEELTKLRGKFLRIWGVIGDALCETYDMKINASIEYFDEEIKDINVDSISFACDHFTEFGVAFDKVAECIARSKKDDSKYAIIFMTDGLGSNPDNELNTLNGSHGSLIKKFWTLSLGQKSVTVLEQINAKMNGTYFDVDDSSLLVEAYAEIARTL
ncbi:unnamed protein product, partial [Didymodactylos carnosus]